MSKEQNPETKLFVPATFVSFRRSHRKINPNQALLEIVGVHSKEEAKFYVGKKVASIIKKEGKETINWGTITLEHGNNGVVRAKFERNLPPQMLGKQVRVMLYPSNI
jgi:large subunit ribosomal protein L35Ae